MIEETWNPIKGYEELYEVSNLGRVRSLDRVYVRKDGSRYTINGRLMKPFDTKDGYKSVKLRSYGNRKTFRVHRLVAQAFIPNPDNYMIVNHKDEDRINNRADNLEWCTNLYNLNYGSAKERLSISHKRNPVYSKPVEQYTIEGQFIKSYPSAKEAAKQTGLHAQNIGACCRGLHSHSGGYRWKYKE